MAAKGRDKYNLKRLLFHKDKKNRVLAKRIAKGTFNYTDEEIKAWETSYHLANLCKLSGKEYWEYKTNMNTEYGIFLHKRVQFEFNSSKVFVSFAEYQLMTKFNNQ